MNEKAHRRGFIFCRDESSLLEFRKLLKSFVGTQTMAGRVASGFFFRLKLPHFRITPVILVKSSLLEFRKLLKSFVKTQTMAGRVASGLKLKFKVSHFATP